MKKEISPEMYNYNKFPGPSFARVGNKVVSENIELNVVDNFKDAFDQTAFGQRFSPLMLKFDYIVGDSNAPCRFLTTHLIAQASAQVSTLVLHIE